jgi:hypothetical protein
MGTGVPVKQAYLGLAAVILIMAVPLSRFFWRPPVLVSNPVVIRAIFVFAVISLLAGPIVWLGVVVLPHRT